MSKFDAILRKFGGLVTQEEKKRLADELARNVEESMEFTAYNTVHGREERAIAYTNKKVVFVVRECANGYIAEVHNSGGRPSECVGTTLSEVCNAMQAEAASRAVQASIPPEPTEMRDGDTLVYGHSIKFP